jgi:hypothetical protein
MNEASIQIIQVLGLAKLKLLMNTKKRLILAETIQQNLGAHARQSRISAGC